MSTQHDSWCCTGRKIAAMSAEIRRAPTSATLWIKRDKLPKCGAARKPTSHSSTELHTRQLHAALPAIRVLESIHSACQQHSRRFWVSQAPGRKLVMMTLRAHTTQEPMVDNTPSIKTIGRATSRHDTDNHRENILGRTPRTHLSWPEARTHF